MKANKNPIAYSYVRFSNPSQGDGDSTRRQAELRDSWLKRNGATLDTSLTLEDRGVSGFTGKHRSNPDRHALAAFLKLVEDGKVPKGSYLIVESLDRLSREHVRPALSLLLDLLDSGINVVQLQPVEMVYGEKTEPMHLMMAIMELARGHSESQMKSERVGRAWGEKKRLAAKEGKPLSKVAPAWLRLRDNGKWEVIESSAQTVRQIFRWTIDGYGIHAITQRLNREGVKPIGRSPHWTHSYVGHILKSRQVLGEYHPHRRENGKRVSDGEPNTGYYPAIITEEEWYAARAATATRTGKAGRLPKGEINIFAGLIHDALTQGRMHRAHYHMGGHQPTLVSYHVRNGLDKGVTFPLPVFERAVLYCVKEINPKDILPQDNPATDMVLSLSGRLQDVTSRADKVKAQYQQNPDLVDLLDILRTLQQEKAALSEELAQAQVEAASSLGAAWGECKTLLCVLSKSPDQEGTRIKLRAAIRHMVDSIWVVTKGDRTHKIAAFQLWFKGDGHRDYLIFYTSRGGGKSPRPQQVWCTSIDHITAGMDLRDQKQAKRLRDRLEGLTTLEQVREAFPGLVQVP
jgi:DNA invertase Pin-like site-specific DNA recombinase